MTTRHKDFSAGNRQKEPVTFTIDGETFTAAPAIPGATLLDFVSKADSKDGGIAAGAIIGFLEGVVVEEEREHFSQFLRDPDTAVQMETLGEIVEWLISEYTQRPTESPTPSPRGRTTRGSGSTATASATG